jgi:DNA-binding NarL/FixJ family response regulator
VTAVLLVDDQALVRGGLRLIVEAEPDLQVVGEAADGAEAVALAARLHPEVVLMDVRMPVLDGITATQRLLHRVPQAKVIMLTTFDLDEYVLDAFRVGASGFVLKTAPPGQLVAAIRTIVLGEALLAPASTRELIERATRRTTPSPRLASLSARELEVLRLLARGLSNAEIADELVVEPSTIKTHVARLLAKLEVRDRVQAVVFAFQNGVDLESRGPYGVPNVRLAAPGVEVTSLCVEPRSRRCRRRRFKAAHQERRWVSLTSTLSPTPFPICLSSLLATGSMCVPSPKAMNEVVNG